MQADPLVGISDSASPIMPHLSGQPSGRATEPVFGNLLMDATSQISNLATDAATKVRGMMIGDGTDIHTAMIATQKADLAFELVLAGRNKAIAAYQQLMSMQF